MRAAVAAGVLALAACGARAPEVAAPQHAPSDLEVSASSTAIDVDTADCAENVSGRLRVDDGTLVFVGDDVAPPQTDARHGIPWSQPAPVVVWMASRTEHSPSPRVSALVASADGSILGVVGDDGEPAVLARVSLDPRTPLDVVYRAPAGLWLAGTWQGRVLVLVESGERHAFVLLEPGADAMREVARSEEVDVPFDEELAMHLDATLPHFAPRGTDRLLFACDESAWCVLEVAPSALTITRVPGPDPEHAQRAFGALALDEIGALQVVDPQFQLAPFSPDEPANEANASEGDGLPVDGRLASPLPITAPRCLVRAGIELPLRDGDVLDGEVISYTTASIVEHPHPSAANAAGIDVIVRGARLDVGLAYRDDGGEGLAGRRHLGLALPPGTIEVTPVTIEGRAFFHVVASPAMPAVRTPDCVMGRIAVRVWNDRYASQALVERYWEDGYCD